MAFVPLVGGVKQLIGNSAPSLISNNHAAAVIDTPRAAVRAPSAITAPQHQLTRTSSGAGPQAPGARSGRVLVVLDGALRITDNAALVGAARAARSAGVGGVLVPIARIDGSNITGIAAECAAELSARGSELVGVRGDVVRTAMNVCAKLRLGAIYVNRSSSRDVACVHRRLRTEANRAGVEFVVFGSCGLLEDISQVPEDLPKLFKMVNKSKSVPEPLEAPERLPGVPYEARRLGAKGFSPKIGTGTSSALKVLESITLEREMRRSMKTGKETSVLLRTALNSGSVSEVMAAKVILRKLGGLKGATFEELVWRSFVTASYEKMDKVGAKASV